MFITLRPASPMFDVILTTTQSCSDIISVMITTQRCRTTRRASSSCSKLSLTTTTHAAPTTKFCWPWRQFFSSKWLQALTNSPASGCIARASSSCRAPWNDTGLAWALVAWSFPQSANSSTCWGNVCSSRESWLSFSNIAIAWRRYGKATCRPTRKRWCGAWPVSAGRLQFATSIQTRAKSCANNCVCPWTLELSIATCLSVSIPARSRLNGWQNCLFARVPKCPHLPKPITQSLLCIKSYKNLYGFLIWTLCVRMGCESIAMSK